MEEAGHPRRAPHQKPPFTLSQLRRAVPPHCFSRPLLKSASYLLADLLAAAFLLRLFLSLPADGPLRWALWPAYVLAQGCTFTGVWVIAHECGHHAFSDSALLDDLLGLLLHSCLLVPYFSWKFSHRRHHAHTGSMQQDEVFVPRTRRRLPPAARLLNTPPGRIATIALALTVGWPSYLLFNASGRSYDRFASHYDPNSPIFVRSERARVLVGDAALACVAYGLHRLASTHGWAWLLQAYAAPLLVANAFLVLITLLQHTHPALPHYDDSEWDWLRGALSTADRDYGPLNHIFHHITDTHVAHHLFSTMPHYHAVEATRAIKPILGEYYLFDDMPVYKALWREVRECVYVEPDSPKRSSGILWYRSSL